MNQGPSLLAFHHRQNRARNRLMQRKMGSFVSPREEKNNTLKHITSLALACSDLIPLLILIKKIHQNKKSREDAKCSPELRCFSREVSKSQTTRISVTTSNFDAHFGILKTTTSANNNTTAVCTLSSTQRLCKSCNLHCKHFWHRRENLQQHYAYCRGEVGKIHTTNDLSDKFCEGKKTPTKMGETSAIFI